MSKDRSSDEIREAVRKQYGEAITKSTGCCVGGLTGMNIEALKTAGYDQSQLSGLSGEVTSFGCGNPIAFMELKPGETVLDLGSGAGLDLILASKRVGPTGKVIGLDMTPEMIEECRRNLRKAGVFNAEVRQGQMEQMPVANEEVDWIMSNCVINLSPEKERVFAEAFRVLKPGGRILVSDIVAHDLSEEIRNDMLSWVGCIAGAIDEEEYIRIVRATGFEDVKVVDRFTYGPDSIKALAGDSCGCGCGSAVTDEMLEANASQIASIRLHARKPA